MKGSNAFLIPCILAWVLWLAFSLFFGFDRLYGDAAFYLFDVINDLRFSIAHHRPAGYLIEFIPLWLAKNNAPMEQIILWFSLNESLVLISFSMVAGVLMKDFRLSLAVMLPFFLGDRYNYFNPVSELLLATPVFILIFGCLYLKGDKLWVQLLFLPITVFVVYSHPLYYILLPLSYGLIFLLKKVPTKWNIVHAFFIVGTILLRYFTIDEYDLMQFEADYKTGFSEILNHFSNNTESLKLLMVFAGLLIVVVLSLTILFKRENKIIGLYASTVFFALIGLVIYKYSHLFPDTMEPFERYLFPASIFVSLLFYVSSFHPFKYWPSILTLIIVFQAIHLFNYGKKVQSRNYQLASLIEYGQQHHYSKVIVKYFNFNPTRLGHDWIMTSESLLLSKMIGNKKNVQVAVYESYDAELLKSIKEDQFIYFPWWSINTNTMNPEYFNMYPQALTNVNANTDSFDLTSIDSSLFEVKLESEEFSADEKNRKEKLMLMNKSAQTIFSGLETDAIQIEYKWVRKGVEMKLGGKVALLADLKPGTLKQLIIVDTPKEAGTYDLAFYFVFNEKERKSFYTLKDICVN